MNCLAALCSFGACNPGRACLGDGVESLHSNHHDKGTAGLDITPSHMMETRHDADPLDDMMTLDLVGNILEDRKASDGGPGESFHLTSEDASSHEGKSVNLVGQIMKKRKASGDLQGENFHLTSEDASSHEGKSVNVVGQIMKKRKASDGVPDESFPEGRASHEDKSVNLVSHITKKRKASDGVPDERFHLTSEDASKSANTVGHITKKRKASDGEPDGSFHLSSGDAASNEAKMYDLIDKIIEKRNATNRISVDDSNLMPEEIILIDDMKENFDQEEGWAEIDKSVERIQALMKATSALGMNHTDNDTVFEAYD